MEKQLTLEQKKQKVQDFRPIDDVFFEVLADDELFCQEILRIILEDEKLIVNDIFGKGKTIYHVKNVIQETGDVVDDGLHRIFVNTACDDGTDIADLMSCFTEKQVNNPKFPVFTSRMNRLKNEEGGLNIMCEVMQKYEQIAAKKERIEAIQNMIDLGLSEEKILTKYSKQEYEEAKQGMLVEA